MRLHRRLGPWVHRAGGHPRRGRDAGLCAAGQDRRPSRDRRPDHHLPRHAAGRRGLRPAADGRPHLVPVRAPQDALRDLVGRAPVHVPGGRPVVRPPAVDRRPVPGSSGRSRLVDRRLGAHRRHGAGLPLGRAAGSQPASPADACTPSKKRRPASCPWSCVAATSTACRSPAASSCTGASCKRGMWWQAHPYSLSALPHATSCASPSRISATTAPGWRRQPGTRVAIEGPYGAFTHHARHTDRVLLVAAGVGATPVRAMLDDLPRARGRGRRSCAAPASTTSCCATRSPAGRRARRTAPPGRGLALAGPARRAGDRAGSSPTSRSVTCTSADRAASCAASSTPPAPWACRTRRIHHEDFAF